MVFTAWWPLDSRGQCPSKGAVIIINHHHKPCCVGVCVRASTGPCVSLDAASQMLHLKSLMKAPGGSATSSPDSVGTRTTSLTGLHAKIKTRQRWRKRSSILTPFVSWPQHIDPADPTVSGGTADIWHHPQGVWHVGTRHAAHLQGVTCRYQ